MLDLLGQAAIALAGLLIGYFAFGDSSGEGCNGHHWGEPVPYTDMSALDREKVDFDGSPSKDAGYKWGDVYFSIDGGKKCQDCGAWTYHRIHIGTLPTEAFEDGWDVVPSDAYELDDDFGGSDWVVEQ